MPLPPIMVRLYMSSFGFWSWGTPCPQGVQRQSVGKGPLWPPLTCCFCFLWDPRHLRVDPSVGSPGPVGSSSIIATLSPSRFTHRCSLEPPAGNSSSGTQRPQECQPNLHTLVCTCPWLLLCVGGRKPAWSVWEESKLHESHQKPVSIHTGSVGWGTHSVRKTANALRKKTGRKHFECSEWFHMAEGSRIFILSSVSLSFLHGTRVSYII